MTSRKKLADDKLPVRMLHDRVLVSVEAEGERKSSAGILIPATAQMGRRLAWAKVVAIGANVRTVEVDDRVLFDPEDRAEVEVRGDDYILLRERDLHAVAANRLEDGQTASTSDVSSAGIAPVHRRRRSPDHARTGPPAVRT